MPPQRSLDSIPDEGGHGGLVETELLLENQTAEPAPARPSGLDLGGLVDFIDPNPM